MFTAGRICPHCHYARLPEDFAPECECPRCGIIYAKVLPPEAAVPSDLAVLTGVAAAAGSLAGEGGGIPPAGPAAPSPRPASLQRRALAAIYTGSLALLIMVPLKLLVYAAIRITHPPGSIKTFADLTALHSLENLYSFVLALVLLYAFLLRPFIDGATWGQQKFGLTVRRADGDEWFPTARAQLLRFAGQLVALAAFPATLAALLFGLATGRTFPSLADRLSTTRQFEADEPLPPIRRALNRAFMPACIALIVQLAVVGTLSAWMMSGYLEQSPRRANRPFAQTLGHPSPSQGSQAWAGSQPIRTLAVATASAPAPAAAADPKGALRQASLGFLTNLQRRHLNERGIYTADLEALVLEYGADVSPSDEILRLIDREVIRARLTSRGVELWVQMLSGEWRWVELRG